MRDRMSIWRLRGWRHPRFWMLIQHAAICCRSAQNWTWSHWKRSLRRCSKAPTRTEFRAVASMLHEFYNGVERILERIAVGLGEGVPQGSYGHADLLVQMATAREGVRPAVVDEALRARLKDYLDFRRFFRHAYGYTLEWSQLRWKAELLSATLTMLRDQLRVFFERLTS
jgi:hypothetical protein